jgi:hypothetical protein
MEFNIPIITKTKTVNIAKLRILIMEVQLFQYAHINVILLDEQGTTIESTTLTIDGVDYKCWVDDNYLMEWIKNKIAEKYN